MNKAGLSILASGFGKGSIWVGEDPKAKINSLAHLSPIFKAGSSTAIGFLNYKGPAQFYVYDRLKKVRALPKALGTFKVSGKLEMSLTRAQYAQKFKKIQALIQAGEIYQVNFAIRFRQRFQGDPYALFTRWMKKNPATFGAYIDTGKFQILSASPERLLKVEKGMIITEPIKGTAAKSGGKKALETLLKSEKERAELDMITDLERNDIGKISEYGTVKVLKSRAVKELPNLWHCYSVVQGKLQKNATPEIILDALFPGGSITGCPKVRAMEVIENLEGLPRNIFTGSIGLVQKGKMDFNIAIRTALVKDGFIEYWAGGGIVADSNCDAEYDEALLKAERFLGILKS